MLRIKKHAHPKAGGRNSKLTESQKKEMVELYNNGQTVKDIAKKFDVTPITVYRYFRTVKGWYE